MRDGTIRIRGARQNNLAGLDVDLPRESLIAVTGVSGSGKSSLAFDTLYREGQRRFLETLSAYARQFLGHMQKPDVEAIEGLSPAIAVDQKTSPRGARSTVGTLTEIVDHLRVLFARAGQAYCPECERPIQPRTPESIVQEILRELAGKRAQVMAPVIRDRKGHHRPVFADLQKKGYVRVRVDGVVVRIEEAPELERYKRHTIEVVLDRLKPDPEQPSRLREAVESAVALGDGDVYVEADGTDFRYSTLRTCPGCGAETPPLEPRLFSFNSPHGACETCDGLGGLRQPTEAAVVKDRSASIREGALAVTRASGGALLFPRVSFEFLERIGKKHGFDLDTPWAELSKDARDKILHGTGEERFADTASWSGERFRGSVNWKRRYRGVLGEVERSWKKGSRKKQIERFLSHSTCPDCDGSRLRPAARAVQLGGVRFAELTRLPVTDLPKALKRLRLERREKRIARDLLAEILRRSDFLLQVGLGYLTLERAADTLSGGEAQRIRLAAQLGAGLQGVLYVLDEPSIGLHARDHERLLGALVKLRDAGNTVVVVEHDEATLRRADWLVDIGPGAGRHGGQIVAQGTPAQLAERDTPTGRMLRGEIEMPVPSSRRSGNGKGLHLRGARAFNLKDVEVRIPLGTLTVVSGVSGSGKSTLIDRTLKRAVWRHLGREVPDPGDFDALTGLEHIDDLICIDAAPIGRTTRSNPATYTKVLGPIRELFAQLPEALIRGYTKSRFSFNVAGGRCEACCGGGARYVELQFLAPVTVPCEECGGHRFQAETLDVRYRDHSIADVLAMTASEALELFSDHPKIRRPLELMVEIGLGYLTLGQPSTTISGGEAQRLKLVSHLSKRPRAQALYLLDEPTTGLHTQDVSRLLAALQRLVDLGHTVVVVEHSLELIRAADYVIDLGPEGGDKGGKVLATGTPEDLERSKRSHTGKALRELSEKRQDLNSRPFERSEEERAARLSIQGAAVHNLKNIDVEIPRNAFTVVTGPSGSGKSSLALDTIHTEGRRRFVESLSTYARQFLGTKDKPPYERIEGLGPSVAVEARTAMGHPRSTVATTTEIHDHLRVLWARAGTPRCPDHGEVLQQADAGKVARKILKDVAELGSGGKAPRGWVLAPIFGHGRPKPASEPDGSEPGGSERGASKRGESDAKSAATELAGRVEAWRSAGFVRIMVDGVEHRLDAELPDIEGADVDLVIDRVAFEPERRARLAEAIEQGASVAHGRVSVQLKGGARFEYSTKGACTQCGFQLDTELEPRHFSFNTHVGACETCDGLGETVACAGELLVSRPERSILDGAIAGKLGTYLTKGKGYYENLLRTVGRSHRIPLDKPFEELSEKQQALVLLGTEARDSYRVHLERHTVNTDISEDFVADWPGLCGHVDAWHKKTDDAEWAAILETAMRRGRCPACEGERLKAGYRFVSVGRKRLPEMLNMTVTDALAWVQGLKLRAAQRQAVEAVLGELSSRLGLLEKVGLGYLDLARTTGSLSGGEARRVRLSASLGSELVGVCYVLDEPTVGLHPADVDRLTDALVELRDRGNTVIVVEHDAALMRRADWLVDMGPGAGEFGGTVVASGTPDEVAAHPSSQTAAYLRGDIEFAATLQADREAEGVRAHRPVARQDLELWGASTHNLKGVDLRVAFGEITGICGPSGSGKSTLVLDTLVPALKGSKSEGRWKKLKAPLGAVRTVVVDAAPIGRTPHSVPATYTGMMPPLRELFARTPEARMRGLTPAHFSFNGTRGRCPACEGRGATLVEMQFLADLWLTCEECEGARYAPEVLEVRYRGRSIADVLQMSVEEAQGFLAAQPKLVEVLKALSDVGLGYMKLGQSSTTLSGGEAQRVKLASELLRAREPGSSVVILDEPTTGLSASDGLHLARVLGRLARRGDAVIVIEHNLELLEVCDRLIELGPAGGSAGGRIIATGTPVELAADPESITGSWLALEQAAPKGKAGRTSKGKSKTSKGKSKGGSTGSGKTRRKACT